MDIKNICSGLRIILFEEQNELKAAIPLAGWVGDRILLYIAIPLFVAKIN